MKRIIKVLAATALMVVLMATTVSPAFAANGGGWGLKCSGPHDSPNSTCGDNSTRGDGNAGNHEGTTGGLQHPNGWKFIY